MSVPLAYLAIIVIWSTTPLGIKWSGEDIGYEFGLAARMLVGLFVLLAYMQLRGMRLTWDRHSREVYLAGGLPMFLAMSSVYWSAQYIPSGWISIIFGVSPIMTGILAIAILRESAFSGGRLAGMLIGLSGLCVIFLEGIDFSSATLARCLAMFSS